MKFILECGEIDGLILIDKSYLTELNSDMLYAMEQWKFYSIYMEDLN